MQYASSTTPTSIPCPSASSHSTNWQCMTRRSTRWRHSASTTTQGKVWSHENHPSHAPYGYGCGVLRCSPFPCSIRRTIESCKTGNRPTHHAATCRQAWLHSRRWLRRRVNTKLTQRQPLIGREAKASLFSCPEMEQNVNLLGAVCSLMVQSVFCSLFCLQLP